MINRGFARIGAGILAGAAVVACLSAPARGEETCWKGDPKAAVVEWTAYKFTEKKPVTGKLLRFKATGPEQGKSVLEILKRTQFDVDLSSSDTGDKGRDTNLFVNFFERMMGPVRGSFIVKGRMPPHAVQMKLSMNGRTRVIPMDSQVSSEGVLELTGKLDILEFGGKAAFEQLKAACEALHTGSDGKSVTWSEVGLRLRAPFSKFPCPGPI
ncbi:MAG: YceI family protein [Bdellovibrionales bacterium]|nr:YceI family protein [Bdellovibrionales bacterium]